MAEVIILPTLSTNKNITNTLEIMATLFKYFVISDYSQSNTFKGKICSLKDKLVGQSDSEYVKTLLTKTLYTLYSNFFKNVDVVITYKDNLNIPGVVDYIIDISVLDYNNEVHTLSEAISVGNGDVKNIDIILDNLNNLINIK